MPDSATILIRGEESDLKQSLDRSHGAVEGFGSSVKGMLVGLGAFIVAKKIFDWGAGFVSAAAEAQQVERRLESVLDKTGKIAGHTKEQIQGIAEAMQELTVHDDEAALGAATVLAQFKNLASVNFERTLTTAADLSAVMGGDLASNAEKLGRALNTPGEGLRTLRQMGVAFTKDQAKVIQELAATGRAAEAQKIILDQLSERFGGAAAKNAETFSGKVAQMKNRLGNMAEEIGGKLIPIIEKFMPAIEGVANFLGDYVVPAVLSVIDTMIEWGGVITDFLQPVFDGLVEVGLYTFTAIQTVIQNFAAFFELTFLSIGLAAVKTFEVLRHWLTKVIPAYLAWFADNWRAIWNDSLNFLKTIVSNMWKNIVEFWQSIKDVFKGKGFDFEWTPLLEGFKKTIKELPEIAEREMGPLERTMEARVKALSKKISRSFEDNLAANRAFLGGGAGDEVMQPAGIAAEPGTPAYYKEQKERERREALTGIGVGAAGNGFTAAIEGLTDLNRRITSAAGGKPEDKIVRKLDDNATVAHNFAKRNADASEKVADAMPKVIEAVGKAGALK